MWGVAVAAALAGIALAAPPNCTCECCETTQLHVDEGFSCGRLAPTDKRVKSHFVTHLDGVCASDVCQMPPRSDDDDDMKQQDSEEFCYESCFPTRAVGDLCSATKPKAAFLASRHAAPATPVVLHEVHHPPPRPRAALLHATVRQEPGELASERGMEASEQVEGAAKVLEDQATEAERIEHKVLLDSERTAEAVASAEQVVNNMREELAIGRGLVIKVGDKEYAADLSARKAAASVRDETEEEVEDEQMEEAAKRAEKTRKERKEKMAEDGKKASAAASKPYMDAMNGAVKTAGAWQKAGDANNGLSLGMQQKAQMDFSTAYLYNQVGSTQQGIATLRNAHEEMHIAQGLSAAANNAYQTAAGIMKTVGLYPAEAVQAGWNAEQLVNPNAPPPPPPIV